MIKEFKQFIKRGNVIDLAVGVIMGGAFGKIVSSMVNDLLMPLIGILIGGLDFSKLTLQVKDATINYGLFIQNIIDFLIIAICIFLLVRFINKIDKVVKPEEPKKEEKPKKSDEVLILEDIKKILKDQNKKNAKK